MAGRHKNSRKGPKGIGEPDASKDRMVHDAARGVKLESVRDLLSKEPSLKEAEEIRVAVQTETDRGMALISTALAETGLYYAIYRRLPNLGEQMENALFRELGAPLATFSARITMARCMAIIGPETEELLGQVRRIRNVFAHALRPIDFSNPTISNECANLHLPEPLRLIVKDKTARKKFEVACHWLYSSLFQDAMEQEGRTFMCLLP